MTVVVIAWGTKHGPAPVNNFEFNLRGLHNPYRLKGLRYLTGHDKAVRDNVWESPNAEERYCHIRQKVSDGLSWDVRDVVVVFTCFAGRHRSVTFARRLVDDMRALGAETRLDTPFAEEKENGTRV